MNFKRKTQREAHKKDTPFHCGRPMIEKLGHGHKNARIYLCPKCGKVKMQSTGPLEKGDNHDNSPAENQ